MDLDVTLNYGSNLDGNQSNESPREKGDLSARTGGPDADSEVKLKRTISVWNGVSIIIGVIVGSGIFVSPKGVFVQSGSIGASLIVWSLCGLLALLGALCFAELGTSIAASGGEYTYIRLAYGPLPSFLYLWMIVIVIMPCSNAISALTFANYIIQPLYPGCAPPEQAIRLVALAILLILVYVNCVSTEGSIRLQSSFATGKILALFLIISYGLYYVVSGQSESLRSSEIIWANTETNWARLAQAFYAGFYSYSGW